jgi:hypothetical protein
MTLYIAQKDLHGQTKVWQADDEADAIRKVQAGGYDMIAASPAELLHGAGWPERIDAVLDCWGVDPETDVDLEDAEDWGDDTDGHRRLRRFQPDRMADLDGAQIGRVGDYDVIYLPDAERGAMVSNGDADWFNAVSFPHASLFAQGSIEQDASKSGLLHMHFGLRRVHLGRPLAGLSPAWQPGNYLTADTPGTVWDLIGPIYDSGEAALHAAHQLEAVFDGWHGHIHYSYHLRGWVCDGIRD